MLGITLAVSCESKPDKRFTELSPRRTNIDFSNTIQETEEFNILDYLYFYNGGGIASGDINNDGLPDLYFTSNQGKDKLYLNQGDLEFKDITESADVGGEAGNHKWTTGATMVDINADGWLDIYVCEVNGYMQLTGKNRLYINNHNLTFTESAKEYGLDIATYSQQPAFFDADQDGDLDLFLLNHAVHTPDSYQKSEIRKSKDVLAGDLFFINENGRFRDATEASGIYSGPMGYGLSVNIADINNDTYPDIYVGNDFHENDYLYYNKGDGTFEEAITQSTKHNSTFTMGADIADYDNDGWLDIFTLDMKPEDEVIQKRSAGVDAYDVYNYKLNFGYHYQYSRNMLQRNSGSILDSTKVVFSEIGQLKGIATTDWSWSASFADLDNNGFKDLFVTNGIPRRPNDLDFANYTANEVELDSLTAMEGLARMPEGAASNYSFANEAGSFENVSESWGINKKGFSNGALPIDLDNDGDLDLVINNLNEPASIYKNNTMELGGANYLNIQLAGPKGNQNGIGARALVFSNGKIQLQENKLTSGWLSSRNSDILHFGLGVGEKIDSVQVIWRAGKAQTIVNVEKNSLVAAKHGLAKHRPYKRIRADNLIFKDMTAISGIDFLHRENDFDDFNREKMIPHLLSTEGPKMAVADVNGDGLDDFYIGGAKGQSGELYLQRQNEKTLFKKNSPAIFKEQWVHEDTDAVFFDADADGDQDLYVVSGGSELFKGEGLQDRLYLNDGEGNFSYDPKNQLPNTEFNGSCVVAFDANADGLMDLFVGNRSYPTKYGLPAASKFFLNRGQGKFADASISLLEDRGSIGMVTDAVWIENEKELVIAGEWMPVTIYSFKEGNIERKKLENTSGWWNAIEFADLNNDGIQEILLGNLGLNTNMQASVEEPMDLYVYDFDGNLSTDPIISYYKNGKRWPYANLDLLAQQIVNVKRTYRTYYDYANSSFSEIFPDEQLNKGYHSQVQTLASSYLESANGKYVLKPLPESVQYAAINGFVSDDFDNDGNTEVIAVGNFYGNQPSMGRSDASYGSFLKVSNDSVLVDVPFATSGFAVDGEARDIKIMNGPEGKKWVLVSFNNRGIKLFQSKN
ncbi:VCBS repeat-containing protein [Maribacter sp. 2307ULW6-5]|uniref:VCBS repeat-containing protein n=1 Tax=Maribacter sp. 2307ULW6-5 TaxID=3386275 RepID=UPI0039BCC9ED